MKSTRSLTSPESKKEQEGFLVEEKSKDEGTLEMNMTTPVSKIKVSDEEIGKYAEKIAEYSKQFKKTKEVYIEARSFLELFFINPPGAEQLDVNLRVKYRSVELEDIRQLFAKNFNCSAVKMLDSNAQITQPELAANLQKSIIELDRIFNEYQAQYIWIEQFFNKIAQTKEIEQKGFFEAMALYHEKKLANIFAQLMQALVLVPPQPQANINAFYTPSSRQADNAGRNMNHLNTNQLQLNK